MRPAHQYVSASRSARALSESFSTSGESSSRQQVVAVAKGVEVGSFSLRLFNASCRNTIKNKLTSFTRTLYQEIRYVIFQLLFNHNLWPIYLLFIKRILLPLNYNTILHSTFQCLKLLHLPPLRLAFRFGQLAGFIDCLLELSL